MKEELGEQASSEDAERTAAAAAQLLRSGEHKRALDMIRAGLASHPESGELHYLLGACALRLADPGTAAQGFGRCVQLNPRDIGALLGVGIAARQLGEFDRASSAFQKVLELRPGEPTALANLAELRKPPSTDASQTGAQPRPASLAEILDRKPGGRPELQELAGEIVWQGRPSVRYLISPLMVAVVVLLIPIPLHALAQSLPVGSARDDAAHVWRIARALAGPAALVWFSTVAAHILSRRFCLRRHRIETFEGIFQRRHSVLWLHDLERPVVVRQSILSIALRLGSVELRSTMLPARSSRRRRSDKLGRLVMTGLPVAVAEEIGADILCEALWQRRRMVANFVSSR
jgi:hypothetical protein